LSRDPQTLASAAIEGDRVALAKLISAVEAATAPQVLADLYSRTGAAHIVGLTGPPGAGKSTLTDWLIRHARAEGAVAVVAIDPSSPFTGGAILGDRVRMQDHADDSGVYIRSLASRGHLGGVSAATPDVVAVLDAVGYPTVLVETVGVGQAEVEIASQADTTVVVVHPRWGDSIQASKAGLLEVGDVFVVNKADLDGATATVGDLRQMIEMGAASEWTPPVLESNSIDGTGTESVWQAIVEHRDYLSRSGRRSEARWRRARDAVTRAIQEQLLAASGADAASLDAAASAVVAGATDPLTAAKHILGNA
jgi:LAO/AO transport system kinase